MALITEAFYTARYGSGTTAQIEAFIDDVSAEVVDYVNLLDIDTDDLISADDWGVGSGETDPPDAVQAVVARVVNRAIGNPFGITQEGLGDHQRTFTIGGAGGMLSPKDRKIIRRAVQRSGFKAVTQKGYLPVEPQGLDADDDLVL